MGSGIEEVYIDCIRKRPNITHSSTGRPLKTSYTDTNIKGYLGSQTDIPGYVGGKYVITAQYKFFTNDFSIQPGDFIEYENNVYETIGIPKNTAHQNSHIRIIVQRIDKVKQLYSKEV